MMRVRSAYAAGKSRPTAIWRAFATSIVMALVVLLAASPGLARNVVMLLSVADLLATPQARAQLGDVAFHFGSQPTPQPVQDFGNQETRGEAGERSAGERAACEAAAIEALSRLRERAVSAGANAVIRIESNFHRHAVSSPATIECHMGAHSVVVVLRGELVKLPVR